MAHHELELESSLQRNAKSAEKDQPRNMPNRRKKKPARYDMNSRLETENLAHLPCTTTNTHQLDLVVTNEIVVSTNSRNDAHENGLSFPFKPETRMPLAMSHQRDANPILQLAVDEVVGGIVSSSRDESLA